jgi:two-component system cell cycle sensor histidine kinase/response regulator CckA
MGKGDIFSHSRQSSADDAAQCAERFRLICGMLSDCCYYAVEVGAGGAASLIWIEGAFEDTTGIDRTRIRCIDDLIAHVHSDDSASYERAFQSALSGAPAKVEFRLASPTGGERWLRNHLHPVWNDVENRVTCVVAAIQDITDGKNSEQMLRTIEKRLELAMEGAEIGYWDHCFKTGKIIRSRNWTRMLGYSAGEIKPDLASWKSLIHPDDLSAVERIAADHEAGRIPFFKAAHRLRTRTGDWKWFLNWGKIIERDDEGKPVRAAGIHLDLTEIKQAEQALRESEERYRAVVEQSRDAIYLADADSRRILDCNPALTELTGYSREELRGMTLYDFIDHPKDDIDQRIESIITRRGAYLGERKYRHRDGSQIIVEISVTLIRYDGKEVMCVVARDVTERKRADEERRRLEIHLQEVQRLESLGILAGGIAHDFNNLLVGVIGNANLALAELPPASPTRELIEQIEKSGRRAAELSKQLLAYSGRGSFLKHDVNLSEIVHANINLLGSSVSKKARVTLNLAKAAPVADADATQLRQVVLNLLTNASEALEDRVGDITVSTGVAPLSQPYLRGILLGKDLSDGDYAYLKVTDSGCGIDEKVIGRIFDPYFSTKFPGRGLGLAVVLGIVRGHGGAIDVQSGAGTGTAVTIFLPAGRSSVSRLIGDEETTHPWKGTGTVLVVDDEDVVIDLATNMLKALGFTAVPARNGKEGVDLFRERRDEIAFVLLDMTMPEMDGEATFRELRRINPDVRILVTSGFSSRMCMIPFADDRGVAFLEKPYSLDAMADRIRAVLAPQ